MSESKFKVGDTVRVTRKGIHNGQIACVTKIDSYDVFGFKEYFAFVKSFGQEVSFLEIELQLHTGDVIVADQSRSQPTGLSAPYGSKKSTATTCQHEYVMYNGLMESFEYCRHCDARKGV